jgi:ribosomal protein S18 acetylase RimI-like enzyme
VTTIRDARFPVDLEPVRDLLRAYAANPDVVRCSDDLAAELSGLPGEYGPPAGGLIVAAGDDGVPIGCVAVRPIDATTAEMKRLYLGPKARRQGLGRLLVSAIVDRARALGYRAIRLDTLPTQREAQGIYESMGFVDIEPYRRNPVPGTRFLELRLRS